MYKIVKTCLKPKNQRGYILILSLGKTFANSHPKGRSFNGHFKTAVPRLSWWLWAFAWYRVPSFFLTSRKGSINVCTQQVQSNPKPEGQKDNICTHSLLLCGGVNDTLCPLLPRWYIMEHNCSWQSIALWFLLYESIWYLEGLCKGDCVFVLSCFYVFVNLEFSLLLRPSEVWTSWQTSRPKDRYLFEGDNEIWTRTMSRKYK